MIESVFTETIFEQLADHLVRFSPGDELDPLSGGLLNQVWRVRGRPGSVPETVIVKWAPPYIASAPEVPFDPARLAVEASALQAFSSGGLLAAVDTRDVRPPLFYGFEEEESLLFMEDAGPFPNVAGWLNGVSVTEQDVDRTGAALGAFIGSLHRISARQPELRKVFDNRSIQATRLDLQYSQIGKYAHLAGLRDAETLGQTALVLGKRLQEPGYCVIMGDLWPASIIPTDSGIRIIDWELAHYGRPAQDIGHLTAHLWMQFHRAQNHRFANFVWLLLRRFLESYRKALGSDFERLFGLGGLEESAIHFGSEVLTRTVGIFQQGYLYEGLSRDDDLVQEAVQVAAMHIRRPLDVETFIPFR